MKRYIFAALALSLLLCSCTPKPAPSTPSEETPPSAAAPTPSATLDPGIARHQAFTKAIKTFDNADASISLTLTCANGTALATFTDTWQRNSFGDYAWRESPAPDDIAGRAFFELHLEDNGYSLCIYEGIGALQLTTDDEIIWLTPTLQDYEDEMYYTWLSKYESAEYRAAQAAAGIDPDTGMMVVPAAELSYLDAAAIYLQVSIDVRLSLRPENPFAWSYGTFTVFPAEKETAYYRSVDFIGDSQQYYTFEIIYTPVTDAPPAVIPDGADYAGSDSDVPEGSKTRSLIGIVTLDGDNWHVSGYLTGW